MDDEFFNYSTERVRIRSRESHVRSVVGRPMIDEPIKEVEIEVRVLSNGHKNSRSDTGLKWDRLGCGDSDSTCTYLGNTLRLESRRLYVTLASFTGLIKIST